MPTPEDTPPPPTDADAPAAVPLGSPLQPPPPARPKVETASAAPAPQPGFFRLSELVDRATAEIDARNQALAAGRPLGPRAPIAELTRIMGGRYPVGINMVLGNTGAGKTSWCLQTAASNGFPALYASYEQSALELLFRLTAAQTGTDHTAFKDGSLTAAAARALMLQAAMACRDLTILDATSAPMPEAAMNEWALEWRAANPSPHALIVVDSLQSWVNGSLAEPTEYDRLAKGLGCLERIGQALRVPLIVISEQNRAAVKDGGGVNSGAGHRRIEYVAETVVELDKKADAEPDADGGYKVGLRISKNRHGETRRLAPVTFNGRFQRFTQ